MSGCRSNPAMNWVNWPGILMKWPPHWNRRNRPDGAGWIADISHELRTPLAVLRGELEALQDGIRPLTRAAVDSLFGDVMRLNRLTEDLYQLALSDQGALTYRKTLACPVATLKEDLAALMPEFNSKQLSVQLIDNTPGPSAFMLILAAYRSYSGIC